MSRITKTTNPELRFSKDDGQPFLDWEVVQLNSLAVRKTKKNKDQKITRTLTNSAVDGVVDQRDYFDKDIAVQGNLEGYFIVDKGDYVYNPRISTVAPVGPISRNNIAKGVMSPLYSVFRFNNENSSFFEHFFNSSKWHNYLRKVSNSGARHDRMSISADDFMAMPVPTADELEQQKIADCLSSIDILIKAETRKLDRLKAHKKGLMQQIFPNDGKSVPELRFSTLGSNEDWKFHPLGEIAENLDSKRIPITKQNRTSGDIPYYGASGIIDYVSDYIFDDDLLCISEDGANLVARTYPIAFSISGKTWVNNHAHVLKFKDSYTQVLVENYLNHINLEDYLTGMAQPKLNRAKLNIIAVPLPESEEQKKLAGCLSSIDSLIKTQMNKIEAFKYYQKGLMQQLFPDVSELK